MKKIKNILFLFVVAIAFVSCSKCVDCGDCPDGMQIYNENNELVSSIEVCKDDFEDADITYSEAIDALEQAGCECK